MAAAMLPAVSGGRNPIESSARTSARDGSEKSASTTMPPGSTGPPAKSGSSGATSSASGGTTSLTGTSRERFSTTPTAPSSSWWPMSTTVRRKFGSHRAGPAISSCPRRLCTFPSCRLGLRNVLRRIEERQRGHGGGSRAVGRLDADHGPHLSELDRNPDVPHVDVQPGRVSCAHEPADDTAVVTHRPEVFQPHRKRVPVDRDADQLPSDASSRDPLQGRPRDDLVVVVELDESLQSRDLEGVVRDVH